MHLLMKQVTDVVYISLPLGESRNMFQSVLAKQSCSIASAPPDHFCIERVTGTSCFYFFLVSRNQEDRKMVGFTKWRSGESFGCVVKVV
jgi:hypothetical protein